MKNLTYIALALALLPSIRMAAQEPEQKPLTYGMLLPDFNSLTPEAASLGTYGRYATNGYTGAADISFPLCEARSGNVSLPVTLYYDTSGIKVTQEATSVGLGWNLSYGGHISHIVCGQDDFTSQPSTTDKEFRDSISSITTGYHTTSTPQTYRINWDMGLGLSTWTDARNMSDRLYHRSLLADNLAERNHIPDIFEASFCGHSLSFTIDKASQQVTVLNDNARKYKIEYTQGQTWPDGFTITDDYGVRYLFRAFEEMDKLDSYWLTEIRGLSQSDVITTTYTPQRLRLESLTVDDRNYSFTYNEATPLPYQTKLISGYRNHYHQLSDKTPVLDSCQSRSADGTFRTDMTVMRRDSHANIQEYTDKAGTPTVLIWSYNYQFPVLEIVGLTYDKAVSICRAIENIGGKTTLTEAELRNIHSCISALPGVQATACLFNPWNMVCLSISPNGDTLRYKYDSYGRLCETSDSDSLPLTKYQYHYAGEPDTQVRQLQNAAPTTQSSLPMGATLPSSTVASSAVSELVNTVPAAYHYYAKDHLGNIRAVLSASGKVEQTTHYYPFGAVIADISTNASLQKHKYSGKELDLMHGLNTYDFGARQYDPLLGVWDRVDPKAENALYISPYTMCKNNPINRIDIYGQDDYLLTRDGYFLLLKTTNKNTDGIIALNPNGGSFSIPLLNLEKGIISNKQHRDVSGSTSQFEKNTVRTYCVDFYKIQDSKTATRLFEFVSQNSDVEWSNTAFTNANQNSNIIATSHCSNGEAGMVYLLEQSVETETIVSNNCVITENTHSHDKYNTVVSPGDKKYAEKLHNIYPEAKATLYVQDRYVPYDWNSHAAEIEEVIVTP